MSAPSTPTVPTGPATDPFRDLRWVSSTLGALALVTLVVTWWYGFALVGWKFQPQVLWAIALWSAGVGLGFLFAIPRVLQGKGAPSPEPTAAAPAPGRSPTVYEQRVNTNLEEISDWLTKIIVGITLVQLNELPPMVSRLASQVVADLPNTSTGYGVALIVAFFILGFLFGYLVTRLYLQGALARAERGLSEEGRLELQRRAITAETTVELLSGRAATPAAAPREAVAPPADVLDNLRQLSIQYDATRSTDSSTRLSDKNRTAKALADVVLTSGVSRDWLATQKEEPLVLALASAVQAHPERGDTERLLKAGPGVMRRHVRYRVALAFSRLIEAGLVPPNMAPDVKRLMESYLKDADQPLTEIVQGVMNQLTQHAV